MVKLFFRFILLQLAIVFYRLIKNSIDLGSVVSMTSFDETEGLFEIRAFSVRRRTGGYSVNLFLLPLTELSSLSNLKITEEMSRLKELV